MKVWDLSEYKCLGSYYPNRQAGASSVTIATDDQMVIVGYRDGTIRGFDVFNAKSQIWEISNGHRGHVSSLYADSNYMLSGGQDGAVRVWARGTRQLLIQFNGKFFRLKYSLMSNFDCFIRPKERHCFCVP